MVILYKFPEQSHVGTTTTENEKQRNEVIATPLTLNQE